MGLQVSAIMLGVMDLARSKRFYGKGLGCETEQDFPSFIRLSLGDGSSALAHYEWDAAAQEPESPPTDRDSGASRSTTWSIRTKQWATPWPRLARREEAR
jgi:catechol 2,3-dioxygenase-like lactoylglutathione lyase family enzyme